MSFFFNDLKKTKKSKKTSIIEYNCISCPLNSESNKKFEELDFKEIEILILGNLFIEEHKILLESTLQKIFKRDFIETKIKIKDVISCTKANNAKPSELEIKCCEKDFVEYIEKTKPKIIIGLEGFYTSLFFKNTVNSLRGRTLPIQIGTHNTWFISMYHPMDILKKKRRFTNEWDKLFVWDFEFVRDFLESYTEPEVVTGGYDNGVQLFMGKNVDDLERQLQYFIDLPEIAIDIENYPLKPETKEKYLATMAVSDFKKTVVFPIEYPGHWDEVQLKEVKKLVNYFLLRSKTKYCHNLSHELEWFRTYFGEDVVWKTKWGDTQAQAYTLDERSGSLNDSILSLDSQIKFHFGFNLKKQSNIDFKKTRCIDVPLYELLLYNSKDAKWGFALVQKLKPLIPKKQEGKYNHLIGMQKTLAGVRALGIPIDLNEIQTQSKELEKQLTIVESLIKYSKEYEEFAKLNPGEEFNPGSNQHAGFVFEKILHLPKLKSTEKTNSYSTDNIILIQFAEQGITFAKNILEYREITKLKSTYLDSVAKLVDHNSILHPNFSAMFTSTGRLNSNSPNMQNFPKKKHREVRRIFRAPEGYWIVACDYGQIEARVIAMFSQDTAFVEAIWDGYDIHKEWALRIYQLLGQPVPDKKELKNFRDIVKNKLVFPAFFGSSKNSIGKALGLSDTITVKVFEEFWNRFRGVKQWQQKVKNFYDQNHYVEMLTGSRRHAPLSFTEIYNTPIQGTASDITTTAMRRLAKLSYELKKPYLHPRLNIHDDLTFIISDEVLDESINFIAKEMTRPMFDFINVPLSVEIFVGKNWCDIEEIGTWNSKDFGFM